MAEDNEAWWIEFESGEWSKSYGSEAEAWAALMDLQTPQAQKSPRDSRPARIISSRGLRFAIPQKTKVGGA